MAEQLLVQQQMKYVQKQYIHSLAMLISIKQGTVARHVMYHSQTTILIQKTEHGDHEHAPNHVLAITRPVLRVQHLLMLALGHKIVKTGHMVIGYTLVPLDIIILLVILALRQKTVIIPQPTITQDTHVHHRLAVLIQNLMAHVQA